MVWECILGKGLGRLNLVRGNINTSVFIDILDECLKPNIRLTKKGIFQLDLELCQVSKSVNKF